jgi:PrtD family type I secretion system ABC transporter
MSKQSATTTSATNVWSGVRRCRTAFLGVAMFSGLINVLALTSSLYMLQLYDRVIPSRSVPTLIGLTLLMLLLYLGYGVLDVVRTHVMGRIGIRIDRALRDRIFSAVLLLPLRAKSAGDGLQPVRDLDQIRGFLTGSGPIALFDMPWLPIYLGLVYLLHPWLGLLGTVGAGLLGVLTILTEVRSRKPSRLATVSAAARHALGEAGRRNAEVIRALGMAHHVSALWSRKTEKHLNDQIAVSDVTTIYGTLSKVLRLVLQSAILGLGAYLVILGQVSGGTMIAASILVSRALAPIEIAIANWRGFLSARQSSYRLSTLLQSLPSQAAAVQRPAPQKSLSIDGVWIAAPGHQIPILQNVGFMLEAGAGLGVIGPSASGKSTLARAIVGVWPAQRGTIRLDGATLDRWSAEALGRHVGYLPQDIELFDGTVAQNIARFDPDASSKAIIAAASSAGVHDMILKLPEGYDTRIGEFGASLSAGQRQRIALARALYGDPFLVVLDEPNSNLDAEGDVALMGAIASVRERKGIIVVIAHRPSALAGLDQVLVMTSGQVKAFGAKDDILRKVVQQPAASQIASAGRLKVIADIGQ